MPYQTISTDYFVYKWFEFLSDSVKTNKTRDGEYEELGTYSQGTDWEKVFVIGDQINTKLRLTEQEIIDDVKNFRKRKDS